MKNISLLKENTDSLRGTDFLVLFIFFFYFCAGLMRLGYVELVGSAKYYPTLYNIVFIIAVVLYVLMRNRRAILPVIVCFFLIALIFGVTYLIHPDYREWYFDSQYGIQIQFFRCSGGIWAFLVISLEPDRKKLYRYLRFVCFFILLTEFIYFVQAQRRGYWIGYDSNLNVVQQSYNLGFGYDVLFPLLFFAGEAVLNRKKWYYLLVVFCTILILGGGSRGPLIWVILVFPAMLLYRWREASTRSRIFMVIAFVFLLPLAALVYVYFDDVLAMLQEWLLDFGISSNTIMRMISGNAADMNGREEIYALAWERIKEGGLFGNGAFGERTLIGQYYRWGYAHNFFLELYAAFGYLGGTLLSLLLLTQILKTAVRCKETTDQVVFITFLFASMKLMLSDSFWFNDAFWGLLAILWMWRAQDIAAGIRKPTRIRLTA